MTYMGFDDKVEWNDFLSYDLQLHNYLDLFQVHPMCLCLSHLFLCRRLLIITLHWGMHLMRIHDCTLSFYYFTFLWPKGEEAPHSHTLPTLISHHSIASHKQGPVIFFICINLQYLLFIVSILLTKKN